MRLVPQQLLGGLWSATVTDDDHMPVAETTGTWDDRHTMERQIAEHLGGLGPHPGGRVQTRGGRDGHTFVVTVDSHPWLQSTRTYPTQADAQDAGSAALSTIVAALAPLRRMLTGGPAS